MHTREPDKTKRVLARLSLRPTPPTSWETKYRVAEGMAASFASISAIKRTAQGTGIAALYRARADRLLAQRTG